MGSTTVISQKTSAEDLPTVPDLECTKGYEYHDAIDVIDDEEGEVLDEDEEADDGVYMEMAFDDT